MPTEPGSTHSEHPRRPARRRSWLGLWLLMVAASTALGVGRSCAQRSGLVGAAQNSIWPWLIGLAILAGTALVFELFRRERVRDELSRVQCIKCGYALVDLPPGSPCPECGTPIAPPNG